jgi:hypothetical protein
MNLNLNPGARCLRPDRSYFHPAWLPVRGMAIRVGKASKSYFAKTLLTVTDMARSLAATNGEFNAETQRKKNVAGARKL